MKRLLIALVLCLLTFPASAAVQIKGIDTTGTASPTDYALVFNSSLQCWDVGTSGFVTLSSSNVAACAIALTQQSTGSYYYAAAFPTGIAAVDRYTVDVYQQAGGSPALGDSIITSGQVVDIATSGITNLGSVANSAATAATDSAANGTAIAALPSASANSTAVWSAGTRTITGGNVATIASLAPPTNWALLTINGSGYTTFSNTSIGSVTGSVGSISGVTFPAHFGSLLIDSYGRVSTLGAR